ncbi:MAG: FKBP-type peptidyl-prolyl cis-trans isomerase [Muribaculaceae bacterium]|nr:FKBP-type peptidyl-prolyl cis-trans isomerase [Muribaculaceae bacterium]
MNSLIRLILPAVIVSGALFGGTPEALAQNDATKGRPAVTFSSAETDSINRAYATVMASYLAPYIKENFPNDSVNAVKEFVDGMRHAFDIRHEDQPYFAGVRSAMANFDRFDAMVGMGFPFTPASYLDALQAALDGDTYGMDQKSADAYLHSAMERMYPAPEPPSAASQQAFIDSIKGTEGVMVTPSGLLFSVITEGEGEMPTANDVVRVTYTGALADGTVFDSTERPIDLPVNGVVKGFSEGLQMMKPGGTYRLIIPAELGYGERGAGGVIPPGAALDFTVTLLDIVK